VEEVSEPIHDEPTEWGEAPATEGTAVFDAGPAAMVDDQPAIDDDDAVIVPAPPVEYLGHTHHHPPARAGAGRQPSFYAVEYRRTIIPILFTTGIMMIVFGAARYFVDPDSPLGLQGIWFPLFLFGFGAVSLAACAISVLQLRQVLAKEARGKKQ
jgi:hypothetical protein